MKAPRKAVVLCAGFGTRMAPLSDSVPKPLMPIWGKPILLHTLEMLHRWGVRDVLVNLHHCPAPLMARLVGDCSVPLRITLSFEPTILGTGGALRRAEWFIGREPFWIVNGDIAIDVSPRPFIRAFARSRPPAVLWLTDKAGPRTVEMQRGTVTTFNSVRAGSAGTYTFCGLHLASPALMRHIRAPGFSSIIDAYRDAIAAGRRVVGVCEEHSFWADTGTVGGYLDAHRRILECHKRKLPGRRLMSDDLLKRQSALRRAGVLIDGFAAIGEGVGIAPGARLSDSVVWDNADIGARAVLTDAVVGAGTRVRGKATRMALRADSTDDPLLLQALRRLGFGVSATTVQPLAPRGSARTFTRATCGRKRALVMRYSPERAENVLYVPHARFLKRIGVRVPGILLDIPQAHMAVIEDIGGPSLLDRVAGARDAAVRRLYRRVIDALVPLHGRGAGKAAKAGIVLSEPFSEALYSWEHGLFASQFLRRTMHLPPARIGAVLADLRSVAKHLEREPYVLVHRDLQSTNIIISRSGPVFIDFQGMRLGAAAYDLASLLCDPYVALPADIRTDLIAYYCEATRISRCAMQRVFWYAAVQRLVQALGAYARLGSSRDTGRFLRYIEPGLTMLALALDELDGLAHLRNLVGEIRNQR